MGCSESALDSVLLPDAIGKVLIPIDTVEEEASCKGGDSNRITNKLIGVGKEECEPQTSKTPVGVEGNEVIHNEILASTKGCAIAHVVAAANSGINEESKKEFQVPSCSTLHSNNPTHSKGSKIWPQLQEEIVSSFASLIIKESILCSIILCYTL